jgi:hypothetical protein
MRSSDFCMSVFRCFLIRLPMDCVAGTAMDSAAIPDSAGIRPTVFMRRPRLHIYFKPSIHKIGLVEGLIPENEEQRDGEYVMGLSETSLAT